MNIKSSFFFMFCPLNKYNIKTEYSLLGFYRHKDGNNRAIIKHLKCGFVSNSVDYSAFYKRKGTCGNPSCILERKKESCLEHYGVEFPLRNKEIQEKTAKTNLRVYGCINPTQNKKVREKTIQTNLFKYGAETPMQNESIRKKTSDIIQKKIALGYNPCHFKTYINALETHPNTEYKSTWEVLFQKTHPLAKYEELKIKYEFEGKTSTYFVDFIDYDNRVIYEIKPKFAFFCGKEYLKNRAKVKAAVGWAKQNGYRFRVLTDRWFEKESVSFSK